MIPLVIWYWKKILLSVRYLWCWKWAKLFNRCRVIVHAVFQNTRKDNKVVFRCWGGVRSKALSFHFHFICCPHQRHPVNLTVPPRASSFGSQPPKSLKLRSCGNLCKQARCSLKMASQKKGFSNVSHESQTLTTKQLCPQPHLLEAYWSIERKENMCDKGLICCRGMDGGLF